MHKFYCFNEVTERGEGPKGRRKDNKTSQPTSMIVANGTELPCVVLYNSRYVVTATCTVRHSVQYSVVYSTALVELLRIAQ